VILFISFGEGLRGIKERRGEERVDLENALRKGLVLRVSSLRKG